CLAFGASRARFAPILISAQIALRKPDQAFLTLEEGRAQALLQLLAQRHLDTRAAPPHLQAAYRAAVAARDRPEQAVSQASIAAALAHRRRIAARDPGASSEAPVGSTAAPATAARKLEGARSAYIRARLRAEDAWDRLSRSLPRAFVRPLSPAEAARALPPGM